MRNSVISLKGFRLSIAFEDGGVEELKLEKSTVIDRDSESTITIQRADQPGVKLQASVGLSRGRFHP